MGGFSGVVGEDIPPETRLDRYVAEYLRLLTRSQIKARGLTARLNDRAVKISRLLKAGDRLELAWADPAPADLIPEDLPLRILYEDDRVAVIDKAQGMVVHPGAGNRQGTLANALLFRRGSLHAGDAFRPGIVHRLDKDTSGVIIAAYTDEALRFLAEQFKNRTARKTYLAAVKGVPAQSSGRIETRIARDPHNRKRFAVSPEKGKPALTLYWVLRTWKDGALLLLRPKTGRTHQLRVHLRHIGHPILGDPLYGAPEGFTLMLHALRLTIRLTGEAEPRSFTAPVPPRFRELLPH